MTKKEVKAQMSKRLLVVIPDRLEDLVNKGEITERYYNPGNLFDEILLIKTIADNVKIESIQKMVGKAHLQMVDLPMPSFKQSLGYQPWLLQKWVDQGIELAREFKPHLIRAHSNNSAGYLASKIKLALQVPLIVSLHTHPDIYYRKLTRWWPEWRTRLVFERYKVFENLTNRTADWFLPVSDAGKNYCEAHGVKRVITCYNAVNPTNILPKEDYRLHSPVRILNVNRLIPCKSPERIIKALTMVPNAEYTIVGQGELEGYNKQAAVEAGVAERVHFIPSIPNDDLCRMYKDYDIYASHVESWGIGKSTIEALLAGLPGVISLSEGGIQPMEYSPGLVRLVSDTPEDYAAAINALIENTLEREKIGRTARKVAEENWSPRKSEAHFVEIYHQAFQEAYAIDTSDWQPDYRSLKEIKSKENA